MAADRRSESPLRTNIPTGPCSVETYIYPGRGAYYQGYILRQLLEQLNLSEAPLALVEEGVAGNGVKYSVHEVGFVLGTFHVHCLRRAKESRECVAIEVQ
jgi:hypothetical protein